LSSGLALGYLSIVVLIEKVLPQGQWVGRGIGVALVGWGIATLVV